LIDYSEHELLPAFRNAGNNCPPHKQIGAFSQLNKKDGVSCWHFFVLKLKFKLKSFKLKSDELELIKKKELCTLLRRTHPHFFGLLDPNPDPSVRGVDPDPDPSPFSSRC